MCYWDICKIAQKLGYMTLDNIKLYYHISHLDLTTGLVLITGDKEILQISSYLAKKKQIDIYIINQLEQPFTIEKPISILYLDSQPNDIEEKDEADVQKEDETNEVVVEEEETNEVEVEEEEENNSEEDPTYEQPLSDLVLSDNEEGNDSLSEKTFEDSDFGSYTNGDGVEVDLDNFNIEELNSEPVRKPSQRHAYNPNGSEITRFMVGMTFKSKEEVKLAITEYSCAQKVSLRLSIIDAIKIKAICNKGKCPWSLFISKDKTNNPWMVNVLQSEHTCYTNN